MGGAADKLTPKQEQFVHLVAREGLTNTEAYKRVYDCTAAPHEEIPKRAYALATSAKVASAIATIKGAVQAEASRKAAYTLADAIKEADEILEAARRANNLTAANQAAKLKAQLAGHMVERREIKFGALEQSDVEELEAIRDEVRRRLAEKGRDVAPEDHNRPVLN